MGVKRCALLPPPLFTQPKTCFVILNPAKSGWKDTVNKYKQFSDYNPTPCRANLILLVRKSAKLYPYCCRTLTDQTLSWHKSLSLPSSRRNNPSLHPGRIWTLIYCDCLSLLVLHYCLHGWTDKLGISVWEDKYTCSWYLWGRADVFLETFSQRLN